MLLLPLLLLWNEAPAPAATVASRRWKKKENKKQELFWVSKKGPEYQPCTHTHIQFTRINLFCRAPTIAFIRVANFVKNFASHSTIVFSIHYSGDGHSPMERTTHVKFIFSTNWTHCISLFVSSKCFKFSQQEQNCARIPKIQNVAEKVALD